MPEYMRCAGLLPRPIELAPKKFNSPLSERPATFGCRFSGRHYCHNGTGENKRNTADGRLIQINFTPDLTISRVKTLGLIKIDLNPENSLNG
ncbi:hypothetical protein IVG45_11945 [Methylomonas sp. LL1]|uniref:hypothetical protein n=1 Tax=Methylomonas sp. LL1 TaxID=2785785 RepID=UPI0018C35E9D|nr:hypothetical protein [Methylomonas sp. LL1]QPK61600.1 hypothetical protein IVG45_11945 [Methylomonas sp. LL1]